MSGTIHELKIAAPYYDAVLSGDKNFEIRFNDRGFQKGDTVKLVATLQNSTRRDLDRSEPLFFKITYVTNFAQKEGWVVFGMKRITN